MHYNPKRTRVFTSLSLHFYYIQGSVQRHFAAGSGALAA